MDSAVFNEPEDSSVGVVVVVLVDELFIKENMLKYIYLCVNWLIIEENVMKELQATQKL